MTPNSEPPGEEAILDCFFPLRNLFVAVESLPAPSDPAYYFHLSKIREQASVCRTVLAKHDLHNYGLRPTKGTGPKKEES